MSTFSPTPAAAPDPTKEPAVVRCAWCKNVEIRNIRPADVISLTIHGVFEYTAINRERYTIQDGICGGCRAAKFPETHKAVRDDLATK